MGSVGARELLTFTLRAFDLRWMESNRVSLSLFVSRRLEVSWERLSGGGRGGAKERSLWAFSPASRTVQMKPKKLKTI